MSDFQFYCIMTWLAMIAGLIDKTKFRIVFRVISLMNACVAIKALL